MSRFSTECLAREGTSSVKWDARKAVFGTDDVIPMWVADMDFRLDAAIVTAVQQRAAHPSYGYSMRSEHYFDGMIAWLERRHQWSVLREWCLHSPCIVASMSLTVFALTNPGDRVMIQTPVYPPFISAVNDNERTLVINSLVVANGCYQIDFEDFENKISQGVKLFLLCSPHNPVGRVWRTEELERICEICARYRVVVFADEIHSDLVFSGQHHLPFARLAANYPTLQVVTCLSPSKTFNIAGLQASAFIISDAGLRAKIAAVLARFGLLMTNTFGIAAFEAAYQYGAEWLKGLLIELEGNRNFLVDFIRREMQDVEMFLPEATYLGWLDCRKLGLSDSALRHFFVEKARVGLEPGIRFGSEGSGFLRINFGCPRAQLEEVLHRMKSALNLLQR